MVKQTSLEAFEDIRQSGELGRQEQVVLMAIQQYPESTDKEIAYITGLEINAVTGRRNGLCKKTFYIDNKRSTLSCQGEKHCSQSGRKVKCWGVVEF